MSEFLTSDRNTAIPITPISPAKLPAWLDRHPQSRAWIAGVGFKAEPGTFAFLPNGDGRPAAIIASPAEGAPVYAFADLPMTLPEGSTTVATRIEPPTSRTPSRGAAPASISHDQASSQSPTPQ